MIAAPRIVELGPFSSEGGVLTPWEVVPTKAFAHQDGKAFSQTRYVW